MKKWYLYWCEIVQQPVALFEQEELFQIPWGHNIVILTKLSSVEESIYYMKITGLEMYCLPNKLSNLKCRV